MSQRQRSEVSGKSVPAKKSAGWGDIRRRLDGLSQPALIAVVRELYDASPDNRDYLLARFQSEGDADAALETYRRKIVEQFFPAYGHAQSKLAVARKAIRDYCKAAQNLAGKIEMMLTYVENGTEFTRTLMQEGSALYPRFRERVQRLATRGGRIGWGYGDTLVDQVGLLEKELAGQ